MIIGTGDGGAHADRDDGAEWSTYYIRSWLLDRQLFSLEDGIRRITHLPAMITGIKGRGLLARGYHADVMMFDPTPHRASARRRWCATCPAARSAGRCGAEGVVRVLVNGETIVENGELTGTRAGPRAARRQSDELKMSREARRQTADGRSAD